VCTAVHIEVICCFCENVLLIWRDVKACFTQLRVEIIMEVTTILGNEARKQYVSVPLSNNVFREEFSKCS